MIRDDWVRVLFDHQIFSYQTFGGASRYYCEVMNVFSRTGVPEFDLAVAESPNEYLARSSFYSGHRAPRGGTGRFLRTYARNELLLRRRARARRHDVLHATFYDPGILRRIQSGKLVITVLDMIPERFPEAFELTGLYGRLVTKRWIEGKRLLCERADAILAISETTKQDVMSFYGIPGDRITVTHLGNNLSSTGETRAPDGFPPKYLLFVGTRNTYKNFPFFIEAVAPIVRADAALGIVCIGGGALNDAERTLLDREAISSRVIQRNVRDDELASCYRNAIAFVFPSLYEGFGIPIVEAFACGCPTLVANASCFPEIAADAARYFDPRDHESLRHELRAILDDGDLRDTMCAKGRARARELTWEATAQKTLDVYRTLVGSGASRAVAS